MRRNDFATMDEISHASHVLIRGSFDEEVIEILKCNETKDIKACPGSGKTTALLAKLIILANRMPLAGNNGICVLTHTNVAINEIKHKLGDKSVVLFKYPNFFGTIQSFVDKFLAIPYYRTKYPNHTLRNISDDYFKRDLEKSFKYKMYTLRSTNDELKKKVYSFVLSKIKTAANETEIDYLMQIRLVLRGNSMVFINLTNYQEVMFDKPKRANQRSYTDWTAAEKVEIFNVMKEIYIDTFTIYGSLSYFDAYTFGKVYLARNPSLKNAFSKRFKYLFVDEMQDTDRTQLEILDLLFDNNLVIVQRFGDSHQAIYNKVQVEATWIPTNFLPISKSKRFGENIAKVLRTVCIENNSSLTTTEITSLEPIIIVFENPEDVLPKFCELLNTKEIDGKSIFQKSKEENIPIKALGWVGESNMTDRNANKLTIKSYFRNFRKNLKKTDRINLNSLKSLLKREDTFTAKDYNNRIIRILLHTLYLSNKKYGAESPRNYNAALLLKELKEKHEHKFVEIHKKISKWSREIHSSSSYSESTIAEIKTYIRSDFFQLFDITQNTDLSTFLDNTDTENLFTSNEIEFSNIYTSSEVPDLKVELATIHSTKGETHAATLYLETSYRATATNNGHESERILNQLKGAFYTNTDVTKEKLTKETLKMSYVGLSRARYLLCMAIHKDRYNDRLNNLSNANSPWNIVDITTPLISS